ncbi:LPS assembly protein LptD [Roseomonas sp. OT10]|uniref:LPS-assembly protein LptD n=1 Tax=Roseomonas cutis TaxID=2897332 RepID=UPI001E3136BE|nr:LPS assembly protein LptD [Roseomonas sp. OT10]UFN48141.1 LPS assembly protein LptD [Roseomonas sp. OT10]
MRHPGPRAGTRAGDARPRGTDPERARSARLHRAGAGGRRPGLPARPALAAPGLALALAALALAALGPAREAVAQRTDGSILGAPRGRQPAGPPADRNAPVTFTADSVEYDENRALVTASGNVEAWQNERILRADRMTYDRNTGVAVAEGNVQLLQPDGQVLFADRAELAGGMREGVIEGVSALLAQNGRLIANGARRTDAPGGPILDLSRPVYSSCDLCADDPTEPPLWQVQSRLATRDEGAQRIRFRDATVRLAGVPVLYTPYMSMPDPSTPRSSGFLSPSFGQTRYLGVFTEIPYYWAIDGASDLTVTPTISTDVPPSLAAAYRRRFNFGELHAEGSVGYLNGDETNNEKGWGGHIFSRGTFNIDETWRTGFNLNRATSETYLRAFRFPSPRVLSSDVYAEGFWGAEGYARIDARAYQGLRSTDDIAQIPFVLPNAYYDHVFARDGLGGTAGFDASAFAITRDKGTSTRRLSSRVTYSLPRMGAYGDLWTFRAQGDLMGYWADDLNQAPNYSTTDSITTARANIRAAIDWRMPFVRSAGEYGRQVVEPRLQLVTGPATGRQMDIPNEDSLDFEFTDANLFALNRFTGRDRQEGGTRLDAAMRGAWLFPNGGQLEGIVGQSYRTSTEEVFALRSGLRDRVSDVVSRVTLSPVPWLDLTARTRLDKDSFDRQLVDGSARVGLAGLGGPNVTLTAGYLYTVPNPALTPSNYRREVYGAASAKVSRFWSAGGFGRYDIEIDRPVSIGANITYEDECLIFDTRFYKSYAEQASTGSTYPSSTTVLFRIGLKTLGDFGFRAL